MTAPADVRPGASGGKRRRALIAVLLVCMIGAGGFGGYLWRRPAIPEPPSVPREGVEPAVWTAFEQARAAVAQEQSSAGAWGRLGMVLFTHQYPAQAMRCFVQAEKLDGKEPRWPYYQAAILSLQDPQAAVPKFQQAIGRAGDHFDAPRLRLAELLIELGRGEEAAVQYRQILAMHPLHPLAHLGLARAAYERRAYPDCLAHLEQATASPFTRKAANTLLAAVYQRQGDRPATERTLGTLQDLPDDPPWPNRFTDELTQLRMDRRARLKRGTELVVQDRIPEGIEALSQLVRDCPDFDVAWRWLGFAFYRQSDYANAKLALRAALRLTPESVEASYYMGCVALDEGKPRAALPHLRKAIQLKPDHAAAYYRLGLCLELQGNEAGAIEAFRDAARCRPYLAEAHRSLGRLLARTGRSAEAREHLRQALALDPADGEAKKLLEQLQAAARRR